MLEGCKAHADSSSQCRGLGDLSISTSLKVKSSVGQPATHLFFENWFV
jgi:hypothetical protein